MALQGFAVTKSAVEWSSKCFLQCILQVLGYFSKHNPVYVEWLDDSACNILFRDEFTAKRAIFSMGKPLPPEDIPEGQGAPSRFLGLICESDDSQRSFHCCGPRCSASDMP